MKSSMQLNKIHICLLLVVSLYLKNATAQPEKNTGLVPEVTVTGTIIGEEAIYQHIPKYSISSSEIDALCPSTAVDLLRGIPGLDVTQQGGAGGLTFISIRGGDPNFTVVLIDGIKVDDPTNSRGGGFDFAGLDPLLIEHIDVFYGGFSAVYGSDALGGIISVATKGASSSTRAGTFELGTNNAWAGAFHFSGPLGDAISASSSGVVRQGNNAVEGDSLERQQLSLKIVNNAESPTAVDWGLNFFVSDTDASSFPAASGGDRLAQIRSVEERNFDQIVLGGRIDWLPVTNWKTRLVGGYARYEEDNDSPGIAPGILSGVPPISTQSRYERGNLTFSNTVSISEAIILGFGAEITKEEGQIESLIDLGFPLPADFLLTRDTWAVFGEAAIDLSDHVTLIGSLRHDDVNEVSSTNGRLAATVNIGRTNTSASLVYAEAFKLPSLFALGHAITGNPQLNPESSQSISLNLVQAVANHDATVFLSFYYNKFEELVDFDPTLFTHVNRASATAKGIDFALQIDIGKYLQLTGNAGYLSTKVSDGTRLERRPKWKGNFTLFWRLGKAWGASLHGNFNGDFYDAAVPIGEVQLDGYADIDISIQRTLTDKVDAKLLIDNAFDSSHEEVVGFSTAGRQARLTLSARF